MKYKFLTVITLLLTMTVFTAVSGATAVGNYDYTIFDNEGYNLTTGYTYDDINLSRTNRVEIARDSLDGSIYFDTDDFSHILFFDAYNTYMGYFNGNGSTLELSTYKGDVEVSGDDFVVPVPDRARKFALMNYNYEDTRNQIAYTYPSIDVDAWEGLSYRDIFAGTNLFGDTAFSTDDPLGNLVESDVIGKNKFDGYLEIGTIGTNGANSDAPLRMRSVNYINVLPSTDYYLSDDNAYSYRWYFYDGNQEYISFNTGNAQTTPDNCRYIKIRTSIDSQNDITSLIQIELGATATTYEPYAVSPIISVPKYSIGGISDTDTTQYFGVDYNDVVKSATGWTVTADLTNTISFYKNLTTEFGYKVGNDLSNIILDISGARYSSIPYSGRASIDYEGCHISTVTGVLTIKVLKSKLSDITSADFETYLQSNDVKFVYEFETPLTQSQPLYFYSSTDDLIYNFTDIFAGLTQPTIEEFETLQEYYDLYKDVSGDTLTYDDIFSGGNLVPNGDLSDGTVAPFEAYSSLGESVISIENVNNELVGTALEYQPFITPAVVMPLTSLTIDTSHINYVAVDIYPNVDDSSILFGLTSLFKKTYTDLVNGEWNTVGDIFPLGFTNVGSQLAFSHFQALQWPEGYTFKMDNFVVYDLDGIFPLFTDDINGTFMDAGIDVYNDPLGGSYPTYYPAGSLIANTVWYEYDDTPPEPADATTTIDGTLDDVGVDTPQEKLFMAFLIMAIVAVLLGLKFKSFAVVLIAEIALIFIFTMLGFFGIGFLLIVAVIFVLLILLKALKGRS